MDKIVPITFIIPTYGRSQELSHAISSILNQDAHPAEIIVVDDASPQPICISDTLLNSGKIRLIRLEKNGGPGRARNTGMKAANTDWISFLDSDDWLLPGTLKCRWQYVEANEARNSRKGNTIYGCGWQDVMRRGTVIRQRIPLPARVEESFFRGCWFSPGSCVILNRNDVLNCTGGADETLRRLEDYEWFVRLGLAGFQLQVQDLVGVAIERGSNTTLHAVTEAARVIRDKLHNLTSNPVFRRTADSYLFYERAAAAWRERRVATFAFMLTRSFLARPRLSLSPLPGWRILPPPDTRQKNNVNSK